MTVDYVLLEIVKILSGVMIMKKMIANTNSFLNISIKLELVLIIK